jgi:hypothetical protein
MGLGDALETFGLLEGSTKELEEAVAAFHLALEEQTRDRRPLDWAATQNDLGTVLEALGERESNTLRLEEAVAADRAALEEYTRERTPLRWAASYGSQGVAMMLIADRTNDAAMAEAAVAQIETAYETLRDSGEQTRAAYFEGQLPAAQAIRDRLKGK